MTSTCFTVIQNLNIVWNYHPPVLNLIDSFGCLSIFVPSKETLMKMASLKMMQSGEEKVWANFTLFWALMWPCWAKTMGFQLRCHRLPKFWFSFIKCQGSLMLRISQSCKTVKSHRGSTTQSLTACAIGPLCPCILFQEPGYNIWAQASLCSGSGTPCLRPWSQQFTSETFALISSKTTNTPPTSPSFSKNQFHTKSSW